MPYSAGLQGLSDNLQGGYDDYYGAPGGSLPDPYDADAYLTSGYMVPSVRAFMSQGSIDDARKRMALTQRFNYIQALQRKSNAKLGAESQTIFGDQEISPADQKKKNPGWIMRALGDIGNFLRSGKRLEDRLVRYDESQAPGTGGLSSAITGVVGGILGGIAGSFAGAPLAGAGVGFAVGSAAPGGLHALIDKMNDPGRFQQAWDAVAKGSTFGQVVSADAGFKPGTAPERLVSGTVDTVSALSDDPTSYLAPMLRIAGALRKTDDAAEAFSMLRQGVRFGRTGARMAHSADSAKLEYQTVRKLIDNAGTRHWADWAANVTDASQLHRADMMYNWGMSDRLKVLLSQMNTPEQARTLLVLAATEGHKELGLAPGELKTIPMFFGGDKLQSFRNWKVTQMPLLLDKVIPSKVRTLFGIANSKMVDLESPRVAEQVKRFAETFWAGDSAKVDEKVAGFLATRTKPGWEGYSSQATYIERMVRDGLAHNGASEEVLDKLASQHGHVLNTLQDQTTQLSALSKSEAAYGGRMAGIPEQIISPTQVHRVIAMPTYKDLVDLNRTAGNVAQRGAGWLSEGATQVTGKLKSLWLLRPAFVARTAIDETAALLAKLHFRPIEWIGAEAASFADDWSHSSHAVTKAAGEMLDKGMNAFSNLPGLGGLASDYGVPRLLKTGELEEVPNRLLVRNLEDYKQAVASETPQEFIDYLKSVGVSDKDLRQLSPKWGYISKMDGTRWNRAGYLRGWYQMLQHQISKDVDIRAMLEHFDEPLKGEQKAMDYLLSDEGQGMLRHIDWSDVAKDVKPTASMVNPDATFAPTSALRTVPEQTFADTQKYLEVKKTILDKLAPTPAIKEALANGGLTFQNLRDVPLEQWPEVVPGYLFTPKDPGSLFGRKLGELKDGTWHKFGGWMDNLTRKPGYRLALRREVSRMENLFRTGGMEMTPEVESQILSESSSWAGDQVLRMVHNPAERTKFDVMFRAFMPFSFAEVQYLKRWGRVFAENPGVAHRMETFIGSGTNSGWFDKDDKGNTIFNIPVHNEFLRRFLTFGLGGGEEKSSFLPLKMFDEVAVPKGIPFAAHSLPGFSPFIQIPAAFLTLNKPKFNDFRDFLLGPSSGAFNEPGQGWLAKTAGIIAPSWLKKIGEAVFAEEGDRLFGNAHIDAMRYMMVNHENILDPKVQAKAKLYARGLFAARALTSALSPYSQTPNLGKLEILDDLQKFKDKFGNEEGVRAWLAKHGEGAFGYLLSKSQVVDSSGRKGRSPTPPTAEWLDFYTNHKAFFDKYPDVAGFFAPQAGNFDSDAYMSQLENKQRLALTPAEWLTHLAIRLGDNFYYDKLKPEYESLQAQYGYSTQQLRDWYASKLQQLDEVYPGWGVWHSQGKTRGEERSAALSQVQDAMTDPSLKQTRDVEAIRRMMSAYQMAMGRAKDKGYNSLSRIQTEPLAQYVRQTYKTLDAQYNSEALRSLYKSLLRYEVEAYAYDEVV